MPTRNKWSAPDDDPVPGMFHVRYVPEEAIDSGYMFGRNFTTLADAIEFARSSATPARLLIHVAGSHWLHVTEPGASYYVPGTEGEPSVPSPLGQGWYPIEIAPRDGRPVDVYVLPLDGDRPGWRVPDAAWARERDEAPPTWCYQDGARYVSIPGRAVFWRYPPTPPYSSESRWLPDLSGRAQLTPDRPGDVTIDVPSALCWLQFGAGSTAYPERGVRFALVAYPDSRGEWPLGTIARDDVVRLRDALTTYLEALPPEDRKEKKS